MRPLMIMCMCVLSFTAGVVTCDVVVWTQLAAGTGDVVVIDSVLWGNRDRLCPVYLY